MLLGTARVGAAHGRRVLRARQFRNGERRPDATYCLDDWVIDEVAIYDVVLPSARVKAHYDLGK